MNREVLGAVAAFLTSTAVLAAQSRLSDSEVADAIKAGEARKYDHLISDCIATPGFGEDLGAGMAGGIQRTGSYDVVLSGPAGRIAALAADGKRLYKPFTLAMASDELRAPGIIVVVEPKTPARSGNVYRVPATIDHVVLKSKSKAETVVQPAGIDVSPVEWSNLLGGKVEGSRAIARFETSAVRELPPGDFDIVVITPQGERRCKVGTKDRERLFPKS